jgi:F0F1-type ATP synthase assembly protein I
MKQTAAPQTQFLVAAMNMSWQLAVVVLVPVIGGFEIDKKLHTLPLLTIVGFVVAMAGMALVVWHQLQLFKPPAVQHDKELHS